MLTPNLAVLFVAMLGSPSWHTREFAHSALQSRPDAVPVLRAACCCRCPETAGRAQQILGKHCRDNADRMTAAMGRMPWIDDLDWSYPDRDLIVWLYLEKGRKAVGYGSPPAWEDYRCATSLYVRDLFRDGATPETVRALLEGMHKYEVGWIADNGHRYTPPIEVPLRR